MRAKLAIAIGLGILALTFMIAIKITSLGFEERSQFLMSSVESEVGLAKTNTSLLEKNYAEQLTQAASLEESLRVNTTPGLINTTFLKSPFMTIGILQPGEVSGWKVRWVKNRTGMNGGWQENSGAKMSKELPLAAVNRENVVWYRHLSPTGHALYTFLISVRLPNEASDKNEPMIAFAVLNNQAFSTVVESFKSTTREVMVLDDRGHALAYTSQQYVGAPMDSHPMVGALMNERKVMEVGEFRDRSGEPVVGAYKKLDDSNLYVAVAQKLGSFPSFFSAQLLSLLGFAIASFLIAIALGFLLVRPTIAAYEYLQDLAIALGQGLPLRQPAHFAEMPPVLIQSIQRLQQDSSHLHQKPEIGSSPSVSAATQVPKVVQKKPISEDEKIRIYKEVASGLATALKEPVNVILGQSQLARAKSDETQLKDHYTAIEREARKARATIENLIKVSGTESVQLRRGDLHEIVLAALKEVRPELESYGVHVRKDLRPVGQIMLDAKKLKTAFVEIMRNGIESMVDSNDKELFLVIKDEGKSLNLLIQDTGKGMSDSELSRVFTPFFTTKNEMDHKGLGLSVAKGIVESCSGKLKVDSSGAQGTRMLIEFPLIQAKTDSLEESSETSSAVVEETLPHVQKMPGLADKLPKIDSTHLVGNLPLTGSDADKLPSPPTDEEDVELAALTRDQEEPHVFSDNSNDEDLQLINGVDTDDDDWDQVDDSESEGFTVTIRKPKVGSGE